MEMDINYLYDLYSRIKNYENMLQMINTSGYSGISICDDKGNASNFQYTDQDKDIEEGLRNSIIVTLDKLDKEYNLYSTLFKDKYDGFTLDHFMMFYEQWVNNAKAYDALVDAYNKFLNVPTEMNISIEILTNEGEASNTANNIFHFTDFQNKESLMQMISSIIESGASFINTAMAYLNDRLETHEDETVEADDKATFEEMLESVGSDEDEESVRMDHLFEQNFRDLAHEAKMEMDEVIQ